MNRRTKLVLTGVIAVIGSLAFLALTVSPFQYGPVESAILAGGFVAFALVEFVLGEAQFGAESE